MALKFVGDSEPGWVFLKKNEEFTLEVSLDDKPADPKKEHIVAVEVVEIANKVASDEENTDQEQKRAEHTLELRGEEVDGKYRWTTGSYPFAGGDDRRSLELRCAVDGREHTGEFSVYPFFYRHVTRLLWGVMALAAAIFLLADAISSGLKYTQSEVLGVVSGGTLAVLAAALGKGWRFLLKWRSSKYVLPNFGIFHLPGRACIAIVAIVSISYLAIWQVLPNFRIELHNNTADTVLVKGKKTTSISKGEFEHLFWVPEETDLHVDGRPIADDSEYAIVKCDSLPTGERRFAVECSRAKLEEYRKYFGPWVEQDPKTCKVQDELVLLEDSGANTLGEFLSRHSVGSMKGEGRLEFRGLPGRGVLEKPLDGKVVYTVKPGDYERVDISSARCPASGIVASSLVAIDAEVGAGPQVGCTGTKRKQIDFTGKARYSDGHELEFGLLCKDLSGGKVEIFPVSISRDSEVQHRKIRTLALEREDGSGQLWLWTSEEGSADGRIWACAGKRPSLSEPEKRKVQINGKIDTIAELSYEARGATLVIHETCYVSRSSLSTNITQKKLVPSCDKINGRVVKAVPGSTELPPRSAAGVQCEVHRECPGT